MTTLSTACSVFANEDVNDFTKRAAEIIFRNAPNGTLLTQREEFQKKYPKGAGLKGKNYDRGFDQSVRDPFFLGCLENVANMVDQLPLGTTSPIRVCDFGCGLGHTTILLGLLGTKYQIHVTGIENRMEESEFEKTKGFLGYAQKLHKELGFLDGFPVRLKADADATTLQGYSEYAPSNAFHSHFMGNFLHMFDPATAKKLVEEHAYRMLIPGGFVYASVDGIGTIGRNGKDVYLQAKRDGKKFPSVINVAYYGVRTGKDVEIIEESEVFYSSEVDTKGNTAEPCRDLIERKFYIEQNKFLPIFTRVDKHVCFYDSALIKFVFPSTQWNVMIINPNRVDEDVTKWYIFARKRK